MRVGVLLRGCLILAMFPALVTLVGLGLAVSLEPWVGYTWGGLYVFAGALCWYANLNHQLPVWTKLGPFAVGPEDIARYFDTGSAKKGFRRSRAFTRWALFILVVLFWPFYLGQWLRAPQGRDPQ